MLLAVAHRRSEQDRELLAGRQRLTEVTEAPYGDHLKRVELDAARELRQGRVVVLHVHQLQIAGDLGLDAACGRDR